MATTNPYFVKDPDATLYYVFDFRGATNQSDTSFTNWLASGVTISSYVLTATGVTVDAGTLVYSNTGVKVKISAGTAGTMGTVACKVTTSEGEIDERTIYIQVVQR